MREGVSNFSSEFCFVTSIENFRRGILYCFFYFGYRKLSGVRERRSEFFVKKFCLCAKNFRREKHLVCH